MSDVDDPMGTACRVDAGLLTAELRRRPARPPDFAAENRALSALAREMAASTGSVLQKLVDAAMELCRADSAALSILEPGESGLFQWRAIAGAFAVNPGRTMPREASPCGTVLAQDTVLLFEGAECHFPALQGVGAPIFENLLAPFHLEGRPVGILWAVAHRPERKFDGEDARLLMSLARFASAAYQLILAREAAESGRHELEERTRALSEASAALQQEIQGHARAAAALRALEERWWRMLDIETVGVIFFKVDGRITDANDAFLRMSGYSREDLARGLVRWDKMTPPEFMPRSLRAVDEFLTCGRTTPYEKQYLRKDGSRWWALFAATRLNAEEGAEFVIDMTELKRLEQEILAISGREQRRIGQDLHDDLCQRLGGLQLLSGVLASDLAVQGHPQAEQARCILAQVHETLERARQLARGVAPVALQEDGLDTALQELANSSAERFGIHCEFRAETPAALADAEVATHLYRIAQEAITNAVKHGHAKHIIIRLTDAGDRCELKVSDDGCGFTPSEAATSGMGLRLMKYRAAMIGATLEVCSASAGGTEVTCAFASPGAAQCAQGSGRVHVRRAERLRRRSNLR
jgi:PAS domain S-box-containing protein